jgi:leader peptidase (prepilin peptidase)/N-methyltransferase
MTELLLILLALGTSIGSFIGAAAYRLPRGIPLAKGRSFCIFCKATLRWFEIIPLVSYLALGGKCLRCGVKIPLRDFLVELVTGAIFLGTFLVFGASLRFAEASAFLTLMLLVAIIDAEFLIVPNRLILWGIVLGCALVSVRDLTTLPAAASASIAASGILLLVRVGGSWLFKKSALGMGDVKLASVLGFFLGVTGFLVATWLAALLALFSWTVRFPSELRAIATPPDSHLVRGSLSGDRLGTRVPFGSYLAATSSVVLLFREQLNGIWLAWLTLVQ